MLKKIKQIKFSDFNSDEDFLTYLLENDISQLMDEDGNIFPYTEFPEIWQQNKPEDLKKFKS
jgi:hypothetical protein